MLSLNQQKQLFKNKQLNHQQLSSGTFLFDQVPEFGASNEITYPFMGVTVNPVTLDGNIITSNYLFSFLDLVHQDNRNMDVVMSDMQKVALDIFSQIKYDLETIYNCTVVEGLTLEPRQSVWDDDVSGWAFELGIVQHYDRSVCLTPNSGANAGVVTILDQNGNVLTTLNPNSTYTVEVLQEIIQTLTDPAPVTIIQTLT